jgi:hypothetical protein
VAFYQFQKISAIGIVFGLRLVLVEILSLMVFLHFIVIGLVASVHLFFVLTAETLEKEH